MITDKQFKVTMVIIIFGLIPAMFAIATHSWLVVAITTLTLLPFLFIGDFVKKKKKE